MNSPPDQELIDRCLSGRTEAFGLLVERYQSRLFRALVAVLGSADDALDTAQDAFILAYEKLTSFRGDAAFYSWLFRIALNAAASARRKNRWPRVSIDGQREQFGLEPVDQRAGTEPCHAMDVADRQSLVQQALAQLPEEFRTALTLKEIDGLKYEEIAEIIDCPIGTVRSRIHRARLELREKLRFLMKVEEQGTASATASNFSEVAG